MNDDVHMFKVIVILATISYCLILFHQFVVTRKKKHKKVFVFKTKKNF